MKFILPTLILIIYCSNLVTQTAAAIGYSKSTDNDFQSHWLADSHRNRIELFKKWLQSKPNVNSAGELLQTTTDSPRESKSFKGCINPSEPFQCPESERCIALQFICDGNPGDCPNNRDENEETCTAAKRPAKENIDKLLQAEYALHGQKLFSFIFGHKIARAIEEKPSFWFDAFASAFSVSKTIRNFADKIHMSPDDLVHFQNVVQMIHDGRLEEIPLFAQEAVNQGLASLIEKLYESGFMDY